MVISSSSSLRSMEASVEKINGLRCRAIHSVMAGSTCFFSFTLWPMKLSSTINRLPRQPAACRLSNSAIIRLVSLVRTLRPNSVVISQNSQ